MRQTNQSIGFLLIFSLGVIHTQARSSGIECHLADNYCIECASGIYLSCDGAQVGAEGFVKGSEAVEFIQFGVEHTDTEAGKRTMAMQLNRPPGRLVDYLPDSINKDPYLREQIRQRYPGMGDDFLLYIVDHTALAKQLILKNSVRMYRDKQAREFKSYIDGTVPDKLCDYVRSDVRPSGTLSDGVVYCREQVDCVSTQGSRKTTEVRVCRAESADRCPPVEGCLTTEDPRFAEIARDATRVESGGTKPAASIRPLPDTVTGEPLQERVVPLKRGVNVRSGPGTENPVVFVAKVGKSMLVVGKTRTWLRVESDDGQRGWIAAWLTKPFAGTKR